MRTRTTALLISVSLLFLCSAGLAFGQGTDLGTIRGTVTDAGGGVIPGASVTITDALTNTERTIATNSLGYYEMFGLKSGTYTVTVTAPRMSKAEIKDVVLKGSDIATADAVLKVSSTQESVVVSVEAPLINTEDQTISQSISSEAVTQLPRDSRDVYSFLYLNPNITQGSRMVSSSFLEPRAMAEAFRLMASVLTVASSENRLPASLHWKPSVRSTFLPRTLARNMPGLRTFVFRRNAAVPNTTVPPFTTTRTRRLPHGLSTI